MTKLILGGIVTIATALVIGATGWNFSAVAEMPEKYMNKKDHAVIEQRNDRDHERIEKKIDKILDLLLRQGDDE